MPKEAKYIIFSTILPFVAYGMFYTDISFFLTAVQGISYELMGLVITLIGISTFATSIPLGLVADRYGHKKLFIVSNIIASVIIPVFALTTNAIILLTAAILEGFSEAAFAVSANVLLAEKTEGERRVAGFSLFSFSLNTAFGVGSLVIPVASVFEVLGFTYREGHILLYILLAVFSLASTLPMFKISESKSLKKTKANPKRLFPSKSKVVLAKYTLTGAIVAAGAGMVVPLMTAWFNSRYGISDSVSGPILGISSFVIGAATLIAPSLSRRIGLIKTVLATRVISTVFMVATPLSPNYVWASVMYTLRAFLMNLTNPLEQSMMMELIAEDERGIASGISSALWRLPNALTTFFGAWLIGIGFLGAPFYLASLFYLASTVLFWYFFRDFRFADKKITVRPHSEHSAQN